MKPQQETEFECLVRQNKATIYSVCYLYSRNDDEVADLFQDCMVNIWKGLPGFIGKSEPATWIYRVCLNTCIAALRMKKRRGPIIPLETASDFPEAADSDDSQQKMLRERIKTLGPLDKAIVLLWLENLPYAEIGEIVGVSARNVGVRLHRIKEKLKSQNH